MGILVLARIQMAFQQRHGEKDNSNSDQSEYDDNFDLSIHWANIRPTSTENDSGTAEQLIRKEERLRRRDKLANLKLENNDLKLKLKAAEKGNSQLKWHKRVSCISTAWFIIFLTAFTGHFIVINRQITCSDIILTTPTIILREQWADKELKANTSDLEPLPLPIPRGVIAHHTLDSRCFSYEECVKALNSNLDDFFKLKYSDIGYNYLIGEDGNIYEGRGTYKGAHTNGALNPKENSEFSGMSNNNTIGIAIPRNFSEVLPNEKALKAFDMLIRILQSELILNKCVTLVGRSDVVDRRDHSPGKKLVGYWSHNSPYWHQNCAIH